MGYLQGQGESGTDLRGPQTRGAKYTAAESAAWPELGVGASSRGLGWACCPWGWLRGQGRALGRGGLTSRRQPGLQLARNSRLSAVLNSFFLSVSYQILSTQRAGCVWPVRPREMPGVVGGGVPEAAVPQGAGGRGREGLRLSGSDAGAGGERRPRAPTWRPTSVTQVVPAAASVAGRALGAGPAGFVGGFSDPVPPEDRPETLSGGRHSGLGAPLAFLDPLGALNAVRQEGRCDKGKAPALSPLCTAQSTLEEPRAEAVKHPSPQHLGPGAQPGPTLLPDNSEHCLHPQPQCPCAGKLLESPLKPFVKRVKVACSRVFLAFPGSLPHTCRLTPAFQRPGGMCWNSVFFRRGH